MINKARIYYKNTGEVICITDESYGAVPFISVDDDYNNYKNLSNFNVGELAFIELELGEREKIIGVKSYKVNVETKELEIENFTQEELQFMQQQSQENKTLNTRISDIANYLNEDSSSIQDVEDYILQKEQNKIINGGM